MVSYRIGSAGTGQPFISYPVLDFQPTAFFAMGSPIGKTNFEFLIKKIRR